MNARVAQGGYAKVLAALAMLSIAAVDVAAAAAADPAPVARRLSQAQYRQIVTDIFGPTIELGGRFEPDIREDGLLAVGAGRVSVTAFGLEEFEKMGRSLAEQAVSETQRDALLPCKPASIATFDENCAGKIVTEVGYLLYRRPVKPDEWRARVDLAAQTTARTGNFYAGVAAALSTMLVSPEFLFRVETVEADPSRPGAYRLDAYAKASRLSFFLWNAGPDLELLEAAATGSLHAARGLARQVDRLLASPRVETGARAFFYDMLGFEKFEMLTKDAATFPQYSSRLATEAQEQTLRVMVDHLVRRQGDYRDLFTSGRTQLTPLLASVYNVPFVSSDGQWRDYEFGPGDPRAGLLSQISFLALHSHAGRTSPTLRGKALRELILCQPVPLPPGNIDFSLVQETHNTAFKTARARLEAHATEAMCTGCHKITDPIGLALENFDSIGSYRVEENGIPIDTRGALDGVAFTGAADLAGTVRANAAATSCVVNRAFSYGAGRNATPAESAWLMQDVKAKFAKKGFRFIALLREIAVSDTFYRVSSHETFENADARASR